MRFDNGAGAGGAEWRLGKSVNGGFLSGLFGLARSILGIFGAVYELARLAVVMRLRFGGAYWRWRIETAFGRGLPGSRWELVCSLVEYGRWVRAIRRG
jgi:hypothetical protein